MSRIRISRKFVSFQCPLQLLTYADQFADKYFFPRSVALVKLLELGIKQFCEKNSIRYVGGELIKSIEDDSKKEAPLTLYLRTSRENVKELDSYCERTGITRNALLNIALVEKIDRIRAEREEKNDVKL